MYNRLQSFFRKLLTDEKGGEAYPIFGFLYKYIVYELIVPLIIKFIVFIKIIVNYFIRITYLITLL